MDRLDPDPAGPDDAARPGGPADEETTVRFTRFVEDHWSALIAIGIAVSGSRQEAEDLVQNALAGAYPRWDTLRPDDALAYLRRSIVNGNVSRWRRHRRLVAVADVPDRPSDDGTASTETHLTLMPLVRGLPPRQRAVVVLRYLCDLSDHDIAQTLGIAAGTVRSQALRALTALRAAADSQPTEETS